MAPATQADVERVVRIVADTVVANETYFGDLDAVVGDGDFGYSMARGFEKVIEGWDDFDRTDISTFLKKIAVVITSRIGGTSGPIWGTGFLRAGTACAGATDLDAAMVVAMLRSSVEGIMARGGASLGEKTLLDALVPVVDSIEAHAAEGATAIENLRATAAVARTAAENTREMQAMRGRASYTGERSIGSLDAGAVAVAVLLEALAERWEEPETTG
jgi:dihydroxyacetone kinase phosphoprotein-dependent L subunit